MFCEKMDDEKFHDTHLSYQLLKEKYSPSLRRKITIPYDKLSFFSALSCAMCVDRTVFFLFLRVRKKVGGDCLLAKKKVNSAAAEWACTLQTKKRTHHLLWTG